VRIIRIIKKILTILSWPADGEGSVTVIIINRLATLLFICDHKFHKSVNPLTHVRILSSRYYTDSCFYFKMVIIPEQFVT